MTPLREFFVELRRIEEAQRQTQRQLDQIDRQIRRRMTSLVPILLPKWSGYRHGKDSPAGAFLERYRANLAAITAGWQPEIDALEGRQGLLEQAIAAFKDNDAIVSDPLMRLPPYAMQDQHEGGTMDQPTRVSFERLLDVARGDTGQSRRVAAFVLAWWNADSHGGYDLADLFAVDSVIASDMVQVFSWLAESANAEYPMDYRSEVEDVIRKWRPEAWARAAETA